MLHQDLPRAVCAQCGYTHIGEEDTVFRLRPDGLYFCNAEHEKAYRENEGLEIPVLVVSIPSINYPKPIRISERQQINDIKRQLTSEQKDRAKIEKELIVLREFKKYTLAKASIDEIRDLELKRERLIEEIKELKEWKETRKQFEAGIERKLIKEMKEEIVKKEDSGRTHRVDRVCAIIKEHNEDLKDDPERLHSDFLTSLVCDPTHRKNFIKRQVEKLRFDPDKKWEEIGGIKIYSTKG